jgi:hypothetical protein
MLTLLTEIIALSQSLLSQRRALFAALQAAGISADCD